MGIKYLKVFGERNTGTNYLNQLLNQNLVDINILNIGSNQGIQEVANQYSSHLRELVKEFQIDLRRNQEFSYNYGWKHAVVDVERVKNVSIYEETIFICLIRNPYKFGRSLFKRPYQTLVRDWSSFSEFLRTPWVCNNRDNAGSAILQSPITLWNLKVKSYIEFAKTCKNLITIRYEDLVADPKKTLSSLNEFDVKNKGSFINIETSTKDESLKFDDYVSASKSFNPRDYYSQDDLSYMATILDHDICQYFAYDILQEDKSD